MPHFVVECSSKVYHEIVSQELMLCVHKVADSSGLFNESSIKVRIKSYEDYLIAGKATDFIHIIAYIMEGRSEAQKQKLSINMVKGLIDFAPDVPSITMDVRDIDKETYYSK